jgi:hypothetical protein
MGFDAQGFLDRYAGAYNHRDPEGMRTFFDLSDGRFAVFEDFTGDLIDGEAYSAMLEAAFDATGRGQECPPWQECPPLAQRLSAAFHKYGNI